MGSLQEDMQQLKEKLLLANKILDIEGLARPMGHISVRVPRTGTFLITRRIAPGMATMDDVLLLNLKLEVIEGMYPKTYSEAVIHSQIYKKRPDVNSIAHTHSLYVTALSMTDTQILPASHEAMQLCKEPITIHRKIEFIYREEQGAEIADELGPNKAVMLKGHGAVIIGKSIEEATIMAVKLENVAKQQLLARTAGTVVPYMDEEKRSILNFLDMTEKQGSIATLYGRGWEYYEWLMKKQSYS